MHSINKYVHTSAFKNTVASVALVALFLLSAIFWSNPVSATFVAENCFTSKINTVRASNNLPALTSYSPLVFHARMHTQRMLSYGSLYHSPDLTSITEGWRRLGENVGVGATCATLHAAFMNSAGHKANIVGNYDRVGVGVIIDDTNKTWVTIIFMLSHYRTASPVPPTTTTTIPKPPTTTTTIKIPVATPTTTKPPAVPTTTTTTTTATPTTTKPPAVPTTTTTTTLPPVTTIRTPFTHYQTPQSPVLLLDRTKVVSTLLTILAAPQTCKNLPPVSIHLSGCIVIQVRVSGSVPYDIILLGPNLRQTGLKIGFPSSVMYAV